MLKTSIDKLRGEMFWRFIQSLFCCFCSRIISDILLRGLVPDSDFGGILGGCNWEDVIGVELVWICKVIKLIIRHCQSFKNPLYPLGDRLQSAGDVA
jgi:hypothetical protein